MAVANTNQLPERFGRYHIARKLGQGGMGAVYLAQDTQLDRPVALKVPHFTPEDGPRVLERFLREARAAATLQHPNLCPIHDVGAIGGIPYLTMAFIEGRPLSDLINPNKPLPQRQVAAVVRKVALALQEAHAKGVIHRDLKPANIMIDHRKEPIVMDFGLARRTDGKDVRVTKMGSLLGTPAYMSPEQVQGDVAAMGPACDIYSLGVILYELLSGRLPFEGPVMALLGQVLTQEPQPPSAHRADLDPRLEAICRRAMAKKPADRYASMADLAAALTDYLRPGAASAVPAAGKHPAASDRRATQHADSDLPVFADLQAPTERLTAPSRRSRKSRLPLLAAGAVMVVLLLGAVFYVSTDYGTARIELSDPAAKVEIKVDGNNIEVSGVGDPVRLRAGEHEVVVTGKDFETVTRTLLVKRGTEALVQVELKPKAQVAAAKPAPPAAKALEKTEPPPAKAPEKTELAPPKPAVPSPPPAPSPMPEAVTPKPDPATPVAKVPAGLPAGPPGSPLRFLGYVLSEPRAVGDVASYTNLISDRGWLQAPEDVIQAARQAGRPVMLTLPGTARKDVEDRLFPLLEKHRDVIAGVNWVSPYYYGATAADVAEFGRRIKQKSPGLQYWISLTNKTDERGKQEQGMAIPDEVDGILVSLYDTATPEAVRRKVDDSLPAWLAKANGRPVLLRWTSWTETPPSLAGKCKPGTLRACIDAARKYRLAGVLFDHYGPHPGQALDSLDTNPVLVEEIRAVAGELGFAADIKPAAPAKPPPVFQPLFNGKNLAGWVQDTGDKRAWQVDRGELVFTATEANKGWLLTQRSYTDFVLRLEFQLGRGANSGVAVRASPGNRTHPEIQLQDDSWPTYAAQTPDQRTGALYRLAIDQQALLKPVGAWNDMEIELRGDMLRVAVNGRQVLHTGLEKFAASKPDLPGLRRGASGPVGLQNWVGQVRFRKIELKDLAAP